MINDSSTRGNPAAEKITPYALLGMTVVTGLVDAVSFLSLGRVFTANMTGNIVILAFATAHVSGLSITRDDGALVISCRGDIRGTDYGPSPSRITNSIRGKSIRTRGNLSSYRVVLQWGIQERFTATFFSTLCANRLDGARDGHTKCRCREARNP